MYGNNVLIKYPVIHLSLNILRSSDKKIRKLLIYLISVTLVKTAINLFTTQCNIRTMSEISWTIENIGNKSNHKIIKILVENRSSQDQ